MTATDSRLVPVFSADITTGLVRAFLLASLPAGVHGTYVAAFSVSETERYGEW